MSRHVVLLLKGSQDKSTFTEAIRDTPATVVEGLICFFSIWSIVGLWGYHTYLICRSITTNEDIKNTWSSLRPGTTVRNPYAKGSSYTNCFATLCGPVPPSFLNPRAIVKPDDDIRNTKNQMITLNNMSTAIRYQSDGDRHHQNNNSRIHSTMTNPHNDQKQHRYTQRDYV